MATHIGAVILAGGKATRMGGEKPMRVLHGRTLLAQALHTVRPLADEIVVSTGSRELQLPAGVLAAPDMFADAGPLAGIQAGLAALTAPRVLILPCDLPGVPVALLRVLLRALDFAEVAFCIHEAPEPLVCAVRTVAAQQAAFQALKSGRNKVVPVWQSLRHATLRGDELAKLGTVQAMFRNLNTLADLEQA